MNLKRVLIFAYVAAACGCTVPAQSPRSWTSTPADASTQVRVSARIGAWDGVPEGLHRHVTPVLVSMVNGGERPLRVRLDGFALVSSGETRLALTPAQMRDQMETIVGSTPLPVAAFDYSEHGPYSMRGADPAQPREGYWHRYGTLMQTLKLPTFDMMRKALPEGVLHPGGRVTGFLYFEPLPPTSVQAQLRLKLPAEGVRDDAWFQIPVAR